MISKQQFKDWLESAKDFSLKQMSRANKFFWTKMALWMPKVAKYSEQKAIKLNVLKTPPPPPVKLDSSSKLSDQVITVLNSLQIEVHQSHLSLNTNVDPCTFITSVVGNCLKLNQPLTHYQRLNDAIKNLTNNKVSLLIPNVGEDVNTVEHNVVGQQTVSKGKLNVVANLIRPGVKCDAVIKRKAEVVQN